MVYSSPWFNGIVYACANAGYKATSLYSCVIGDEASPVHSSPAISDTHFYSIAELSLHVQLADLITDPLHWITTVWGWLQRAVWKPQLLASYKLYNLTLSFTKTTALVVKTREFEAISTLPNLSVTETYMIRISLGSPTYLTMLSAPFSLNNTLAPRILYQLPSSRSEISFQTSHCLIL